MGQIAFNLASLIIVGVIAERRMGTLRWLVLYLVVGQPGELLVEWLDPTGSGNSLAVCGLVGGLASLLVVRPGRATRMEVFVVPYYVASVAGLAFGGVWGATVASGLVIAVMVTLLKTSTRIPIAVLR